MSWLAWLHHVTIHVPIVGTLGLGLVGIWLNREPHDVLWKLMRWAGWATAGVSLVAVVSGMVTADEFWTADGPYVLIHHRNLGLTGMACALVAAGAVEWGMRTGSDRIRRFGALCWLAAALAMVGAGHWGGSGVHSDRIPWQGEPPQLQNREL
jgi:hypothetical protein